MFHPEHEQPCPQRRPWAACVRSVKCPTRHPLLHPVAFIPHLHDPCLLGSCVPPSSYGEALFYETITSLQPIRDSLSPTSISVDVTPGLCSYQPIGTRINSGALEVPLSTGGLILRSRGGSIDCIALLSPFILGAPPVAQMPPQLSPLDVLTIATISRRAPPEHLSEVPLLRVPKHPVSQGGR